MEIFYNLTECYIFIFNDKKQLHCTKKVFVNYFLIFLNVLECYNFSLKPSKLLHIGRNNVWEEYQKFLNQL